MEALALVDPGWHTYKPSAHRFVKHRTPDKELQLQGCWCSQFQHPLLSDTADLGTDLDRGRPVRFEALPGVLSTGIAGGYQSSYFPPPRKLLPTFLQKYTDE